MSLIRAAFCLALLAAPAAAAAQQPDIAPVVRRVAATAQLAAQEYRIGVVGGTVVAAAEVEEAQLFLTEARRSADKLPAPQAAATARELDALLALVGRTASPDTVDVLVRALTERLGRETGIDLDQIPPATPSLARGAELYGQQCASCHGITGGGDGPAAAALDPAPAVLRDHAELADLSVLDFYRRITIGVAGTAMPAYEGQLSADDRWAVALYASTLRLPAPQGDVPLALRPFTATARLSDVAVARAFGLPVRDGAPLDGASLGRVAAVRAVQDAPAAAAGAEVFADVRALVDSSVALARMGDGGAASGAAFDAYMIFERIERTVRARSPATAAELEAAFAALRTRTAGGATDRELDGLRQAVLVGLEKAERTVVDVPSPTSLFVQSFILLLREGLEAILIIGALMTFLVKMGAAHRRRDIHIGVVAAIGVSLLTAVALETVFQLSPAAREALEGLTMVAATVVLFYVSYWLLSKMEVVKWTSFVKGKVHDAVSSGSALALASAAFLAVYREGVETVLFYKALFVSGGPGATVVPVVSGMVVGSVVLVGVYLAINRWGVRLPLQPFFAFTSAFLYYMAFVFAGKGVAELQEGGLVGTTLLQGWPRLPALGIYPTLESLLAQGVLVVLALGALVWVFGIAPRREAALALRAAAEAAERRASEAAIADATGGTGEGGAVAGDAGRVELLRSLERMEGDLAALRAEVQRVRDRLAAAAAGEAAGR